MATLLTLIGAGFAIGTLIGVTGMGGGALMTPFLILVMKLDPTVAIGTDLTFAAITKWSSGLQHRRQKTAGLRVVFWLATGSLPASLTVSSLAVSSLIEDSRLSQYLGDILGVVLILVAIYTLAREFNWIKVKDDPNWPPAWILILIGAVGGALVGLTSVGSGTIIMASLLIFFSIPPAQMVGLDVLHGALLTTVPAWVYAHAGLVDWHLVLWLLIGSVPGGWLGARLVSVVPYKPVRVILSGILLVAGYTLVF